MDTDAAVEVVNCLLVWILGPCPFIYPFRLQRYLSLHAMKESNLEVCRCTENSLTLSKALHAMSCLHRIYDQERTSVEGALRIHNAE
jgi:hypothetical protein